MMTLYQFPISHFCEKVRWALKFKGIDHKIQNVLPGPHVTKIRRIAPHSNVPVLVDDARAIQGSSNIIHYLDEKSLDNRLTPEDPKIKAQAMAWETEADEEIGIHIRTICYQHLLDQPHIVIPLFTQDGPWYGKWLMQFIFPKLSSQMRKFMDINEESAREARKHLHVMSDKVLSRLREHTFLAGDRFSRADLTVASLLAPLAKPQGYGLHWPKRYPEPLEELREELSDIMNWVIATYQKYR